VDCSGLTSVTIPNSDSSIGMGAFLDCSSLTSVAIPNSVTSIEEKTFYGCSSLTSITIPNSVTTIGADAFMNCTGLTSVTIPNSVTSIELHAFAYCSGLEDFYCWANNVPSTNSDTFESTPCNSATLHVLASSADAYKNTYPWSQFGTIIALADDDPSPTGMNSLKVDDNISPEVTYSLDGQHLSNPQRGLNIIRMSDGSTKKVMIK
jgi:hypothetical protein